MHRKKMSPAPGQDRPLHSGAPRSRALAVALVLLPFLTFSPVFFNDFVRFDDHLYITENPFVSAGLTAAGLRWALTTMDFANWFPLTWISHMLDVELYGFDPRGHHLTNLVLHATATLLLWAALRALTGAFFRSALVAALFAVHPLHVESVAWAAERKDVLAGFFWMLTLLAYVRYARRRDPARYLAVFAALACGLMAKPVLVTLPFVLLLLDFWPLGGWRPGPRRLGILVLEKVPLLGLAAAGSILTFRAQAAAGTVALDGVSTNAVRFKTALVSYWRYLGKTVWPQDLSVLYHYHMHRDADWIAILAAAALLGVTVFALLAWRRRPWLLVGWLWYLGTLVPMIGIVQVGIQSMADRYSYLPLIGVFLVFAWGLTAVAQGSARRLRAGALLVAVILPLLGVLCFLQVGLWRNTSSLFAQALRIDPNNVDAHLILSGALIKEGRVREANEHLLAALRLNPRMPGVNAQLGYNLLRFGNREEAVRLFREDIRIRPTARAHRYLAGLLEQEGRGEEAEAHYREGVRLEPGNFDVRKGLGLLLAGRGAWAEALPHLREAAQLNPDDQLLRAKFMEALVRVRTPPPP